MSFAYLADAAACAVEAFLESWCSPVVPLPIVPVPEVPEVVQAHERLRELVQHPFFEGVEGERGSSGKLRSDGDGGIQSELCGGGDGRLEGELEGELERESEHHGLGQGKRSRPRSFSEKEDNRGGETKGDSASSQGIATVGLTESLLRNKSIKGVLSAEDDTAINQLLNGKWTVGCRVGGDLEAAGALAMAKAVRTLATSQSPSVIANILKAYLPVVVAGFAELPMDHQHGVVALLTPSEAEVEKIRKVAAGHEGGKVKGKFKWRLKHIFLAHDEGHSGTNKVMKDRCRVLVEPPPRRAYAATHTAANIFTPTHYYYATSNVPTFNFYNGPHHPLPLPHSRRTPTRTRPRSLTSANCIRMVGRRGWTSRGTTVTGLGGDREAGKRECGRNFHCSGWAWPHG